MGQVVLGGRKCKRMGTKGIGERREWMKEPGPNMGEGLETMLVEIVKNALGKSLLTWWRGSMGDKVVEVMEGDITGKNIAGVGGWKGEA